MVPSSLISGLMSGTVVKPPWIELNAAFGIHLDPFATAIVVGSPTTAASSFACELFA